MSTLDRADNLIASKDIPRDIPLFSLVSFSYV